MQLEALAEVAERYSRGFGHITTRQNIQFHFVQLADAERAFERLAAKGLTTREACGNSVRNITACQYAGTAEDEVFDVTPYAEALTRYFLRHPLSSSLPRKFKIAFEGCPEDHAFTGINDIGWRAAARSRGRPARAGLPRHGGRRHRDDVAGGRACCSSSCRPGDMLDAAEAIVRVFHRLGDYQHKHKNRMKFLIKQLGWERFQAEVLQAYDAIVRARAARRCPSTRTRRRWRQRRRGPRRPSRRSSRCARRAAASDGARPRVHARR